MTREKLLKRFDNAVRAADVADARACLQVFDALIRKELKAPRPEERQNRDLILQAAIEFAQHALKKRADKWGSVNNWGRQNEALECREVIALAISGLKTPPSPLAAKEKP